MEFLFSELYKNFSETEKKLLLDFKDEAFYFVGKDIKDYDFWQQFLNLFFVFHYVKEDKKTVAEKYNIKSAKMFLYAPSRFSLFKGFDFFSEQKLSFKQEELHLLEWFQEKEFVFSFFYEEENKISFVEIQTSFLITMEHSKFLKKIKKLNKNGKYSREFIFFILIVLFLKKERYEPAKLYSPFVIDEFEKVAQKYTNFINRFK